MQLEKGPLLRSGSGAKVPAAHGFQGFETGPGSFAQSHMIKGFSS
jgi:hypothetical protein